MRPWLNSDNTENTDTNSKLLSQAEGGRQLPRLSKAPGEPSLQAQRLSESLIVAKWLSAYCGPEEAEKAHLSHFLETVTVLSQNQIGIKGGSSWNPNSTFLGLRERFKSNLMAWGVGMGGEGLMGKKGDICTSNAFNNKEFLKMK